MGFSKDLLHGVAGEDTDDTEESRGHVGKRVRESRNTTRDDVHKQEVERRGTLSTVIEAGVQGTDAVSKPYDSALLLDLSKNPVTQTYLDTMAQDAASANWRLERVSEDADITDGEIAAAEKQFRQLPGEGTLRDLFETTARGVLTTGDMANVLHFSGGYNPNRDTDLQQVAEIVAYDPTTLFKTVDDNGFTTGYVQISGSRRDTETTTFDRDEVAWFSWGNRVGHIYGMSPVEKGQDTIEVIEEIAEKEILDLIQGTPPGIISRPGDTDMPIDANDWNNFKEDMKLNEGERHRLGYAKFPVDYTPLTPNYQELQLIERYKIKVTELGGVFKVNPSYAGFDFENTNRATDETQQTAYKQRGFRVLLRLLETGYTESVVKPFISDELRLSFERESTTTERKEKAQTDKQTVLAGKEAADAGLSVSYRDGKLEIENGEIEAGNVGSGGGDGGGLFGMSTDDSEGDTGNPNSRSGGTANEKWKQVDDVLYRAFETQIMPATAPGVEKRVWTSDEGLPEYVKEVLSDVLDEGRAIFDEFESVPGRVEDAVADVIGDNLLDDNGWSLGEIADDLQERFDGISEGQAETVARTETSSVLNEAREDGYENRPDAGGPQQRFMWVGPDDSRTTDACEKLKSETNPDYGGTPVTMPELKRLEEEIHNEEFPDLEFRTHVVHINERHTFRRALPNEIDANQTISASKQTNPGTAADGGRPTAQKELPDSVFTDIAETRFVPPEGAATDARQALEWIDEHGRDEAAGATQEGLARARQIIDHVEADDPLTETNDDGTPYVVEIANYFNRHRENRDIADEYEGEPWRDNGYLSWLLWGGDAADAWANRLRDRLDDLDAY